MYRFFKNIVNTIIIILAAVGLMALYKQNAFDNITEKALNLFSADKEKTTEQVGDFSNVNEEFSIGTAVNVLGYKTVVAEHSTSGQKMIIVDSGKKKLLTKDDIKDDGVKVKLEDLCKKFKYQSSTVENIEIIDKGYMDAYGQKVPYVKFNAKVSKLPMSNISGVISVVDEDAKNQRLIVSINDKKHYSQLITSEFYKNVKESKYSR
ncbi:MAG: hypothetical protein NC200_05955 [Candidatus Gastranaerophilales bacterium]|nr:hypothetical protein [Candidatus Gastranaerophilales bacterium]